MVLEDKPKSRPGPSTTPSGTSPVTAPSKAVPPTAEQDADRAVVHPPSIHTRSAMGPSSRPSRSLVEAPAPAVEAPEPVEEAPGPGQESPLVRESRAPVDVTEVPLSASDEAVPDAVGRAGRNLPVAIAVAVGLGAAVMLSLVIYRPAFLAILFAAVLTSVWELTRALRTVRVRPPLVPLLLGAAAMIAVTWLSGQGGLAVTTMLTVLAAIVWRLSDGPVGYFRDASTAVLITMYVPLLAGFAVLMLRPDDGAIRIITFIVVVVCSDVGGYVAGVLFGRHPMSPTVSPKKSWEGLGGSMLACMIGGLLLVGFALDGTWWQGIVYGAAIAVTATLGDLGESIVKRDLGIKDMGNLLPGHGGLMDRMDSLLPAALVAYLLLSLFVPPVIS